MSKPGQNQGPRRVGTDIKRLRKFLERAERALRGPVFEASPPTDGGFKVSMNVTIQADGTQQVQWLFPDIGESEIVLAITNCRPFLLKGEDNYLPDVLCSLRALNLDQGSETVLDQLAKDIASTLEGGDFFRSVRAGPDNPHKPMRGDFELAEHYIYGTILHEDEWRRAELKNHDFPESVMRAVVMHLNHLMKMAYYLRLVMLRLDEAGSLQESLDPPSGRPA